MFSVFCVIIEAKWVVALLELKVLVALALEMGQLVSEFVLLSGRVRLVEFVVVVVHAIQL
jgi:hypothetical protein